MADTEIEANAKDLDSLFSADCLYRIPFYQRPYEWRPKQRTEFLDDLRHQWVELSESERSHFLGAVVLAPVEEIQELGYPKVFQVIDGQQRLTTALLTGFALLQFAASADGEGENPKDEAQIDRVALYFEQFLVFGSKSPLSGRMRLELSQEDSNQMKALQAQIAKDFAGTNLEVSGEFADVGNGDTLLKAYKAIKKKLRSEDFLGTDHSREQALDLFSCLLRAFKVVAIQLPTTEDPHQIFDSLNTKGLDLASSAVIRNLIFSRYGREDIDDAQVLYNGKWKQLKDSLGSTFDDYLFPLALIVDPKITKSAMVDSLKKRWHKKSGVEIVDFLSDYVREYRSLTDPEFDIVAQGNIEDAALADRIGIYRSAEFSGTVLPYLMQVVAKARVDPEWSNEAASIFQFVESFLVRRAFSGIEPTGLHALFKSAWADGGDSVEGLISLIDKNATISIPQREEFRERIKNGDLYHRKICKFIITQYEKSLPGDSASPKQFDEMTIDHVLPQVIAGTEWADDFEIEDHEMIVNTWANLVPLSPSGHASNAAKGQKGWAQVRPIFREKSGFKTPRKLANDYTSWTKKDIGLRCEELQSWALDRWHLPGIEGSA